MADLMLQASHIVASMKGCKLYLVQQSLSDEHEILITELWTRKEDHQASLAHTAVRALINRARPIIASMDGKPARLIGGHGVAGDA